MQLRPTPNQQDFIRSICENHVTICDGVAGSGKTFWGLMTAINKLSAGDFDHLILTRPLVSCGNKFPSLPGNVEEKICPYFVVFEDYLKELLPKRDPKTSHLRQKIEMQPVELMRGKTFHNSFVLCDEAQNLSAHQIKLLITRIGKNSKLVICGDTTQKDTYYEDNGLLFCKQNLQGVKNCNCVLLTYEDIKRNTELAHIVEIFDSKGIT